MEKNLGEEFLKLYYKTRESIKAISVYESLKKNPVVYRGETSVNQIQNIINYKNKIAAAKANVDLLKSEISTLSADIIDLLKFADVASGTAVEVYDEENTIIRFYYDDYGNITYNNQVKS
jgi:hypothetical protein